MGIRLTGEPVKRAHNRELLTEGVSLGAVQIPPDGQPIILFVEHQTTGGYPKIANVISADVPAAGQLRPRDAVKFEEVSLEVAVALLRRQEEFLRSLST
jgi:antagonist of KipI